MSDGGTGPAGTGVGTRRWHMLGHQVFRARRCDAGVAAEGDVDWTPRRGQKVPGGSGGGWSAGCDQPCGWRDGVGSSRQMRPSIRCGGLERRAQGTSVLGTPKACAAESTVARLACPQASGTERRGLASPKPPEPQPSLQPGLGPAVQTLSPVCPLVWPPSGGRDGRRHPFSQVGSRVPRSILGRGSHGNLLSVLTAGRAAAPSRHWAPPVLLGAWGAAHCSAEWECGQGPEGLGTPFAH